MGMEKKYMSELLCALILGHFIADYWLQTNKIMKLKKSKSKWKMHVGLTIHVLLHFFTYLIIVGLVKGISIKESFNMIILICIIHYITDFAKVWIEGIDDNKITSKPSNKPGSYIASVIVYIKNATLTKSLLYVVDQIIHIAVIFYFLKVFNYINFSYADSKKFLNKSLFAKHSIIPHLDTILLIVALIIVTTHFFGYLIGIILANIKPLDDSFTDSKIETKNTKTTKKATGKDGQATEEITEEEVIEQTTTNNHITEPEFEIGKYIGMIERIIIMLLVAFDAFTGITFLVAIKAFTRFKQFDDKKFAEYYLIGNLLSILFGIISGFILSQLIK